MDGYALQPGSSLEELDMGGGSLLRILVGREQSAGAVTVIEGVVAEGGPPLHVHDDEDEELMIVLGGQLDYRLGQVMNEGGFPPEDRCRCREGCLMRLSEPARVNRAGSSRSRRQAAWRPVPSPTGLPRDPAVRGPHQTRGS